MNHAEIYMNIKTQRLYRIFNRGIDCTNGREGTEMVCYVIAEEDPPTRYFYRDRAEFLRKFTIYKGERNEQRKE